MSDERWIVVPNWDKYHERADRSMPWFKVYYALSGRDDWRQLTLAARGLLVCIWIEYHRSKGQLRSSDIPARVAQKFPRKTLESLSDAGFIQLTAVRPPEVGAVVDKKRRDKNPLTPPEAGKPRELGINPRALGTNPRAVANKTLPKRKAERWIENGLAAQIPPDQLSNVIADEFGIQDPDLLQELVTKAEARP
jgi:hypothetical protein